MFKVQFVDRSRSLPVRQPQREAAINQNSVDPSCRVCYSMTGLNSHARYSHSPLFLSLLPSPPPPPLPGLAPCMTHHPGVIGPAATPRARTLQRQYASRASFRPGILDAAKTSLEQCNPTLQPTQHELKHVPWAAAPRLPCGWPTRIVICVIYIHSTNIIYNNAKTNSFSC